MFVVCLCRYGPLRRADYSFRAVIPRVRACVCVCVRERERARERGRVCEREREIQETQKRGGRGPIWAVAPEKRNYRHIIRADTASFKSYNHLVHVMTFVMQS